jgi:hypothetical protein
MSQQPEKDTSEAIGEDFRGLLITLRSHRLSHWSSADQMTLHAVQGLGLYSEARLERLSQHQNEFSNDHNMVRYFHAASLVVPTSTPSGGLP